MKRQLTIDASHSRPKRSRRVAYASKGMVRYKQPSTFNRCVIATTCGYDVLLSADTGVSFGFSPTNIWVDGVSGLNYPLDISGIWDLCRVQKVEMTIMCTANSLEFGATATTPIPVCYHAFDPNTSTIPTLTSIRQNSTCQSDRCDKVIRRTFYPNIVPDAVVDLGNARKNKFLSVYRDDPFNGILCFFDTFSTAPAAVAARFSFKVFLEVRASI